MEAAELSHVPLGAKKYPKTVFAKISFLKVKYTFFRMRAFCQVSENAISSENLRMK